MKKLFFLLGALLLLPLCAQGEVINLIENPDAEWAFAEGVPVLEAVFPNIRGADSCILRMDGEVMLVDAATAGQSGMVVEALRWMGIDRVHTGFNTHPHEDHIGGFAGVADAVTLDRLIIAFPEDQNKHMIRAMSDMADRGVPVSRVADGDTLRLGGAELSVIQKQESWFSLNDRSAMLMVKYGGRSLLLTADVEIAGQNLLLKDCPDVLGADVLKYPHHAADKAGWNFLDHVSPEISIVTGVRSSAKNAIRDAQRRSLPLVFTSDGIVRLRTDGIIWVIDQQSSETQ